MTAIRPKRTLFRRPHFQRLGTVLALVLLLKAAAVAVGLAAPARAAERGDTADLFAALSVICTPGGVKMLSSDGKPHAPAATDCPLCSAAAHCAVPSAAPSLMAPGAADLPQAPVALTALSFPVDRHGQPRAPPASIPA